MNFNHTHSSPGKRYFHYFLVLSSIFVVNPSSLHKQYFKLRYLYRTYRIIIVLLHRKLQKNISIFIISPKTSPKLKPPNLNNEHINIFNQVRQKYVLCCTDGCEAYYGPTLGARRQYCAAAVSRLIPGFIYFWQRYTILSHGFWCCLPSVIMLPVYSQHLFIYLATPIRGDLTFNAEFSGWFRFKPVLI